MYMEISENRITQLENGITIDLSSMITFSTKEIPDLSKYADKLVELKVNSNISKIKNLEKLTKNQITKIEGLDTLTNLQILLLFT